jgi:hypothetical protein
MLKILKHVDLLVIVTMDTAVQFRSPPPLSNKIYVTTKSKQTSNARSSRSYSSEDRGR